MFLNTLTGQPNVTQSQVEFILYDALRRRRINFVPQLRFPGAPGTPEREHRTADAYLPDNNIVILIDGVYWHSDIAAREREEIFYRMAGVEVVRIWDWEIENDPEGVINRIPGISLGMGRLELPARVESISIGRVRKRIGAR